MQWTITPNIGVGPLKLGMTREETRKALQDQRLSTKLKNPNKGDYDAYPDITVFIYFDKNEKAHFIEIYPPCEVIFDGLSLLQTDYETVEQMLSEKHGPFSKHLGSFKFPEIGIAFFAPLAGPAKTVSIFSKGYYENDDEEKVE